MTLYAEGGEFEFGEYTVTEAKIIEFAEKFGPQPFQSIRRRRRSPCSVGWSWPAGTSQC